VLQQAEFNRLAPVSATRRVDIEGDQPLGMAISIACPSPTFGNYFVKHVSTDSMAMPLRLSITHHGPNGAANATTIPFADPDSGLVEFTMSTPPTTPPPTPPSTPPPPLQPPPLSLTCPQEAGWAYVYELEDDNGVNDFPSTNDGVAAGFSTTNAYYIGNAALDSLIANTGAVASFCSGNSAASDGNCDLDCVEFDSSYVTESSITTLGGGSGIPDSWKSLSTSFKKMLACMTGQCQDSTLSTMAIFNCDGTSIKTSMDKTFNGGVSYTCRVDLRMNTASEMFHFYGCGLTMYRSNNNLGMESCCVSCKTRDVFQVRYRLP